jgi:WD40 repeat protein
MLNGSRFARQGRRTPMALSTGRRYRSVHGGTFAVVVLLLFAGTGAGTIPQDPDASPQLVLQSGHIAAVHALAFSPDGRWLASGGDDQLVLLWEIATGRVAGRLRGHTAPVRTIAFSPDGALLASGSDDETSIVWVLKSGEPLRRLAAPAARVETVVFSPDGRLVAAGSYRGTALWEVATGRLLDALGDGAPGRRLVMFSADGQSLIFRDREGCRAVFWSLLSRKVSREIPLTPDPLCRVWPSGLVRSVVALGKSGDHRFAAQLADLQAASKVESVPSPLLSPDGRLLAGRAPNGSIGLWEVATARQLHSLSTPGGKGDAVAFSPDGRTLAAAHQSPHGGITLWDVASGIRQRELGRKVDRVERVLFHQLRSGGALSLLTSTTSGATHLWNTGTGQPRRTSAPVSHQVRLRSDGTLVVVHQTPDGRSLTFIDAESGLTERTIEVGPLPLRDWALSADHRLLAYTRPLDEEREASVITVRELTTGLERYQFVSAAGDVGSLTFSGDSRMLLSSSVPTATLWDLSTGGTPPRSFTGHRFALSPTGAWLASHAGPSSRTTSLTNLLSGEERALPDNGSMLFSPSGRYLATGQGGPLSVWDVETGRRVLLARTAGGTSGPWSFCPDERCILVAGTARRWQLWDIATGRELTPGVGATGGHQASFSRDMRWLAIAASDGGIEIWNLHAGTLAASLYLVNEGASWLVTTPSGLFDVADEDALRLVAWNLGGELHTVDVFADARFRPGLLAELIAGRPSTP